MNRGSLRTFALRSLIVSVIATAVLGIVAVIGNKFDDLTVRILLSAVVVSVASLASLTCATLLERRQRHPLAVAGIALAVAAAGLILVGLWAHISATDYWRVTGTTGIVAIATAQICLLWLARPAARFAWVQWAAFAVWYGLAGIIVWMIWGEPPEEMIWRPLSVFAILSSAVTIVIPVLHKLNSGADAVSPPPSSNRMTCPHCGKELEVEVSEGTRISRISADTSGSEKETLIRVDPQHPLDPRASSPPL